LQSQSEGRVSNLELAAKFKVCRFLATVLDLKLTGIRQPSTELESAVDTLLKSAELREEDIQHTEDNLLQMNKLSVEEVAARRSELRKMRELMYRAEIKAKRVAKIKSKTYRKIHRKQKEKLKEQLGDQTDSEDEDAMMKREVERARERATLKHKNNGKWAKQQKMKNGFEEGGRAEIEEMLDRGEKLRRRIAGKISDDSDSEGDDSDATPEDIQRQAFEDIEKAHAGDEAPNEQKSKIFEMKFMKDAMFRKQQEADRQADDFIKKVAGAQDDGHVDVDEEIPGVVVARAGGRATYRPGTVVSFCIATNRGYLTQHSKTSLLQLVLQRLDRLLRGQRRSTLIRAMKKTLGSPGRHLPRCCGRETI
jgi:U3 small nucleolar RNA-associated protein 14